MSEIAKAKKTTVGEIMRANRGEIGNRNLIYPGQKLNIPSPAKEPSANKPTQPHPKTDTKTTPTGNGQQNPIETKPETKQQPTDSNPKVPTTPTNEQSTVKGSLKLGVNEDYRGALLLAQKRTGIDAPALASLINAEAATNKNGKWAADSFNQKTNAMGLTQFLPKTWNDMAKTRGTLLNETAVQKGYVRQEGNKFVVVNESALLALRKDPTLSIVSAAEYAKGNVSSLERGGFIPPNTSSDEKAKYMYFTHHEGLAGAKIHLTNPKTVSEEKAKNTLALLNKGKGNFSTYKEAYADFAEKFAKSKFPAQTDGKTVNSYVQKHGNYAQGYRAWLNDYTDKKIQPNNYRSADKSTSTPADVPQQTKVENTPVDDKRTQPTVSGTNLPDTSKMNESQKYELYADYFKQKGVKLDTRPEQRSILGLRVTTNSKANGNKGAYDDRMVVLWTDKNGQKRVKEFLTANTEPNYRYVANGRAERDVNRDGKKELGRIGDGAYEFYKDSWKYGNALREADNVMPALYDTNGDGNYDNRDTKANAGGILFHQGLKDDVGSMGCQTLPPGKFTEFWNSLGGDNRFTYLLVTVK